jgi:hypothetical protein
MEAGAGGLPGTVEFVERVRAGARRLGENASPR